MFQPKASRFSSCDSNSRFGATRSEPVSSMILSFRNGAVSVGGTLRWDLVNLWREIQTGLGKAGAQYGDSIQSIGVDTWGVDYVLLSETEEMLGLPYCYRDVRTNGLMNHTFTRVPRADIFAQTGLQFMEINTLYQLVAMTQHNQKLLDQAATSGARGMDLRGTARSRPADHRSGGCTSRASADS